MMSAAASLGLSLLWETEVGISHVDKYTYSAEEHIKVCFVFREPINYPADIASCSVRLVLSWRLAC